MALKYFSTVADSCHGHARTLTTALLIVFCSIALSTGLLRKRALLLVRVCLIHDRYQPLAKPLTRRFPKLMRERERVSMREKNDATPRNDRIAILRVSLSAGSFSPFLFFFFFTRAVSSMHVFTVPFFEDFNPAAIQPLIWDSISFEFLFVFNTVRYIRVGAMGNCEQSISPLLLFIKFSNIITFFFLRYLKVKCI